MNANLIKQLAEFQDKLEANIGRAVTIENEEYSEQEGDKVHYNFGGKLERCDDGEFYVRVGEDYVAGAMGVSFWVQNISALEKRVYGELRIILK